MRDGVDADHGHASNVVGGGPLAALRHLVEVLAADRGSPPLTPGEIVATGTLTRALPIKSAERWSTRLDGLLLAASGSDLFRTPGRHPPATDYCRHFLAQIARAQLGPGRSTAAMQDTLLSSKPTMSPRSQVPFTANSLVPHLATHRPPEAHRSTRTLRTDPASPRLPSGPGGPAGPKGPAGPSCPMGPGGPAGPIGPV